MNWGRKKKATALLLAVDIVALAIMLAADRLALWVALNALFIVAGALMFSANKILLASAWYRSLLVDPEHTRYPDNVWYRAHDERNFDLVNIGSSSPYYAFDYRGLDVRAMNWATQPQTLLYDIRLVKNFHSILRPGGAVLIAIMPFTSINKPPTLMEAVRYARTLAPELIAERYRKKALLLARYPIFLGRVALKELVKSIIGYRALKAWAKHILGRDRVAPASAQEAAWLDANARAWAAGWQRQFDIADLHAPLTPVNQRGREVRIAAMRELVDFCTERDLQPVYVIMPMSAALQRYLDADFRRIYIDEYLAAVDRDVPTLDYLAPDKFADAKEYRDAYFFNEQGAREFTARVVADLRERGLLSPALD